MGTFVDPNTLTNGTTADANDVEAKVDAIGVILNGEIDDINIRGTAAIQGSKLADAPNGISSTKLNDISVSTAKLQDNAVTGAKLASHASIDANRAIGNDHIKDGVIQKEKLAMLIYSNASSFAVGGASAVDHDTGIASAATQALGVYREDSTTQNMYLVLYNKGGNWRILIVNAGGAPLTINIGTLKMVYMN